MRVAIDFDRCESHGLCALVGPNVLRAVQGCPARAIQILEGGAA